MKTRKQYLPKKYFAGLSAKRKTLRKKEIAKFGALSSKDPKAYVGFKSNAGIKTRKSGYTAQWHSLFGDKAKSLKEKSDATGVPLKYIQESFNRGMAAWRTGHRPGATQQQWGYARTHSLLLCGKTYYTADSDLAREAKAASASARQWFRRCRP